jgi:predicted GNAT family acetyltransferase
MEISRFDDAAAFLDHAGPFLRNNAIHNNVILGIAGRLVDAPWDDAVMVTVDDGDTPCLAGLMTPPWRLIVSTGPAEAIPILVEALRDPGSKPPGVVGLAAMAEQFVSAWTAATGETVASGTAMNLQVADRVDAPADVRGALRFAKATEAEWVTACFIQFAIDIDADESERGESRKSAAAYMARGEVWVWDVDGAPVSMVCCNRMGSEGARVAPVYTLPEERGRGYASAAVAALTTRLLDDGAQWCAIFADVDNATTNTIYQRIGYKKHGTYREYNFTP